MAIIRTIKCDICQAEQTEPAAGAGWVGWGDLHGIVLNGIANPSLCPTCLGVAAMALDAILTTKES